jgi:hypothetical protein
MFQIGTDGRAATGDNTEPAMPNGRNVSVAEWGVGDEMRNLYQIGSREYFVG